MPRISLPKSLLPLLAIPVVAALPAPARAQRPVEEYEPASRYRTFALAPQLTGKWNGGRDLLFAWGRLWPMGPRGRWVPGVEAVAGLTTGRGLVDRVLAGPRASFAWAFPSQYLEMGRATRAEPYLVGAAGTYGIVDLHGEGTDLGGAPFVAGGIGFRMFDDPWDVDFATFEVVFEKRFGFDEGPPQLYLRIGSAATTGGAPEEGRPPPAPPALVRRP